MVGNYLAGIFIKSEFQNQSIGKSLLDDVKNRCDEITLSVYVKNENGVKFYLKNGFIITSEQVDPDTLELEYVMVYRKDINTN